MFKVEWTEQGEEDLTNILGYCLEQAGVRIAEAVHRRIKTQVGSLSMFPHRCRIGRVAGIKEYVISRLPFIAVVVIEGDTGFILNLVHTARKYPTE
jgi:toxin ParE1/3/4